MEMVNAQTIYKEMILLLGIIGSVGAQQSTNNVYTLNIWSKATASVSGATRNYTVHFYLEVEDNSISSMDTLKSYILSHGTSSKSPFGASVMYEVKSISVRSGWYYDKNSRFIQPLSIGIRRDTLSQSFDYSQPIIRRLASDGTSATVEEYSLSSYPEANSGWHFDYV